MMPKELVRLAISRARSIISNDLERLEFIYEHPRVNVSEVLVDDFVEYSFKNLVALINTYRKGHKGESNRKITHGDDRFYLVTEGSRHFFYMNDYSGVRINSETIRMSESMRRQLMTHRISSKKENAANVASLMDAIESKRQVILYGYSSSNSGDIKNRTVEHFAFAAGQKTVWCYEPSTKTNKVFKVDRISNVQILADRWEYETHHRQGKMDVFRMTGDAPINIKLQLSLMAKNILIEEYPDAEKDLIPTDKTDVWMLDTVVYRMEGIGRFYMGLAGEIQIIDAPQLKEYAQKYCKDYIA